MFTLAVSCLTMSNLPCFMDLTFQVPIQYCALQHQTPDTEHCLCFGPATSFFLELLVIALQSSPGAYWTPTNLGGSSSGVISFCLFILFLGFSWQEHGSGLPFPDPVDRVLSELFAMTCLSWVVLQRWFIDSLSYASPLTMTRLQSMRGKIYYKAFYNK